MRLSLAAILLAAISLPALAQSAAPIDPVLGVRIEALPEVTAAVPSDRTEFSTPGTVPAITWPEPPPAIAFQPQIQVVPEFPLQAIASVVPKVPEIVAPDLPEVVVTIPDLPRIIARGSSDFPSLDDLPAPPDAAAAIAALPERQLQPVLHGGVGHETAKAVAIAPPAASPPAATLAPTTASPPRVETQPAPVATDWKERLDRAFSAVSSLGSLAPNVQMQVRAFYEKREGRPVFSDAGTANARGRDVLKIAARAEEHGLDSRRFARLAEASRTLDADAREIALAQIAVSYARDARGARINPLSVSRLITATPTLPDAGDVLEKLSFVPDAADALESWNPRHEGYQSLRARLAELRDNPEYTATAGGKPNPRIGDIIANMERWRWLPADLGDAHVMVNIPSFQLQMKRAGRTVFETRVVVGKPQTPTPIFSHQMEYLVVNPYWNVPPSIALKEYLPLLQKNPAALQARGLQVVSRGKVVDPASVDWSRIGRSVAIRQPPGERNALGHIKFMFPNDHAVYLHDTPSRGLFSTARRAYSHGCVRVQNPFALAALVSGMGEGRLRGMVGGGERRLDLSDNVHVHLAYFTLETGEDGSLVAREDIYGHHRKTKALLGL